MKTCIIDGIDFITREQWNLLAGTDYPFLRHEFLHALETSGTVSERTGWMPQHCLVYEGRDLVGVMPMYRKTHSRGEYVFDHDWAHAYESNGLSYYPKWLTSIPFTPCEGKRVAVLKEMDAGPVYRTLLRFLQENGEDHGISSWHCLYPTAGEIEYLQIGGLFVREAVQFRWYNRGYRDFQDYLAAFSARKRKNLLRERRRVREQGIVLCSIPGPEITDPQWQAFYQFYCMTYLKRGMHPYLNFRFFRELADGMPDQLLLVLATKDDTYVGAALSIKGNDTLYGRYWGCYEEYDSLHFEACYYQGLEYCLENGLQKFDPGVQGEHKIARGFEPVITYSVHWLRDPRFANAIGKYISQEVKLVELYKSGMETSLPFRKTGRGNHS